MWRDINFPLQFYLLKLKDKFNVMKLQLLKKGVMKLHEYK